MHRKKGAEVRRLGLLGSLLVRRLVKWQSPATENHAALFLEVETIGQEASCFDRIRRGILISYCN